MIRDPHRRGRIRPIPLLLLTLVWIMLWGRPTWATTIGGLLIGAGILLLFPLPPLTLGVRIRPLAATALAGRFLADLVVASIQVAYKASAPWEHPCGRMLTVELRSDNALFATLTAEMTCLVPGSIVVDLDLESRKMLLHLFDAPRLDDLDKMHAKVLAQEERILRALSATAKDDLAREVTP